MSSSCLAEGRDGGVVVAERERVTTVALADAEDHAVRRAAEDLCRDLEKVCGARPAISARTAGARLVIGTIGVSPAIDEAITSGALDVTALATPAGGLRWEGFVIQAGADVVYVAGADRRGTIFGIYDLCEAIGVSPWYWWADVPIRRREHVTVTHGTSKADWPSVRYRGIFLNDEEELEAWARTHTTDDTIGPETYRRVFELVLRLKGNYVWPAMHVNAFNHDPANGQLAQAMGIVIGSSHCDMLLRSNEHEFDAWAADQDEPVAYDYSIPGRNRDELLEYWRASVEQNRHFEVTWTVGMRGIHDYGFSTAAIDADDTLTASDKDLARVRLLEQVIADQRALLPDEAPQIFIPYKEVLPLYDAGLRVPDDVTLVWANDNFGYLRRFPSADERERSGGHGLYYHSSYWSQPPRSYLATSSTPLVLHSARADAPRADQGLGPGNPPAVDRQRGWPEAAGTRDGVLPAICLGGRQGVLDRGRRRLRPRLGGQDVLRRSRPADRADVRRVLPAGQPAEDRAPERELLHSDRVRRRGRPPTRGAASPLRAGKRDPRSATRRRA
jgi:hypothetical protein